jgi:hypothetical protein
MEQSYDPPRQQNKKEKKKEGVIHNLAWSQVTEGVKGKMV